MKLISSMVRPYLVDEIKEALARANIHDIIVVELIDHGTYEHGTAFWMGRPYHLPSSRRLAIEVVVDDDDVDDIVALIIGLARTGEVGDGHISVIPIEHRYDIRTGFRAVS